MWAQVHGNEVVRTMVHPVDMEVDGVTHPKSIFTKWSADDLKDIGIYPYSENNQLTCRPDSVGKIINGSMIWCFTPQFGQLCFVLRLRLLRTSKPIYRNKYLNLCK